MMSWNLKVEFYPLHARACLWGLHSQYFDLVSPAMISGVKYFTYGSGRPKGDRLVFRRVLLQPKDTDAA